MDKYGAQRVRSTPIAEQAIIGAAIGAALGGFRPVAEIMLMDFIALGMDQLVNHAAKLRYMSGGRTGVPMTVRTHVGGGITFGAQHSQSLEGWLMHVPGLKVVVPSSPSDAKGLLTTCIFDDDPCVFVENIKLLRGGAAEHVPEGEYAIPLGKAAIKRAGNDATIVTYGRTVPDSIAAAEALTHEGYSVEVLDLRSLVPLDTEAILESVGRTKRALVVHAAPWFAGPGAEVAALISAELFGQLAAPVRRLGAEFVPIPFNAQLEARTFPSVESIGAALRRLLG
jgi:pyruvate/2-oxoglutarate/acetoin dehydrogenase E1 component